MASLPTYRRAEVAKHNSVQNGVWVTYKHGVYDVTEFAQEGHPGASQNGGIIGDEPNKKKFSFTPGGRLNRWKNILGLRGRLVK